MYNKETPILDQNSLEVANEYLIKIQELNSAMQQEHLKNREEVWEDYKNQYEEIMLNDLCAGEDEQLFFVNMTGINCSDFISGSTKQGMHSVIVRY